jgi:hypothetical protein
MAKLEADRQDLLKETTAYPRRGLLALEHPVGWVLLGEREEGPISIYLGTDSVFQFNRYGYLRRAFWQGSKWAAANGRLEALVRIKPSVAGDVPTLEEKVHRVIHQRQTANELEVQSMQSHWELWRQTLVHATKARPHWDRLYWDSQLIDRSSDGWQVAADHFNRVLQRMPSRLSIAQSPAVFADTAVIPCWSDAEA